MSTKTTADTTTGVEPRAKELIDTVQEVHDHIDRTPSPFDLEQHSDASPSEVYDHFDEWDVFLHRAGIITYTTVGEWVPTEVLLEALIDCAAHTSDGNPTLTFVTENTPFTRSQYESRFGSWSNAKKAAWLPAVNPTRDAIISEIERLADSVDETPTITDLREKGVIPYREVKNEFGSWNAAVTAAGFQPNTAQVTEDLLRADFSRISGRPDTGSIPNTMEVTQHTVFTVDDYEELLGGVPTST